MALTDLQRRLANYQPNPQPLREAINANAPTPLSTKLSTVQPETQGLRSLINTNRAANAPTPQAGPPLAERLQASTGNAAQQAANVRAGGFTGQVPEANTADLRAQFQPKGLTPTQPTTVFDVNAARSFAKQLVNQPNPKRPDLTPKLNAMFPAPDRGIVGDVANGVGLLPAIGRAATDTAKAVGGITSGIASGLGGIVNKADSAYKDFLYGKGNPSGAELINSYLNKPSQAPGNIDNQAPAYKQPIALASRNPLNQSQGTETINGKTYNVGPNGALYSANGSYINGVRTNPDGSTERYQTGQEANRDLSGTAFDLTAPSGSRFDFSNPQDLNALIASGERNLSPQDLAYLKGMQQRFGLSQYGDSTAAPIEQRPAQQPLAAGSGGAQGGKPFWIYRGTNATPAFPGGNAPSAEAIRNMTIARNAEIGNPIGYGSYRDKNGNIQQVPTALQALIDADIPQREMAVKEGTLQLGRDRTAADNRMTMDEYKMQRLQQLQNGAEPTEADRYLFGGKDQETKYQTLSQEDSLGNKTQRLIGIDRDGKARYINPEGDVQQETSTQDQSIGEDEALARQERIVKELEAQGLTPLGYGKNGKMRAQDKNGNLFEV